MSKSNKFAIARLESDVALRAWQIEADNNIEPSDKDKMLSMDSEYADWVDTDERQNDEEMK